MGDGVLASLASGGDRRNGDRTDQGDKAREAILISSSSLQSASRLFRRLQSDVPSVPPDSCDVEARLD